LEQEAQFAAQTILDWLQQGKSHIALIAQDRVAARRIRALLERAQVYVADETGWKLSTTRSAAALAAWFEVVATRADTEAILSRSP
jgi:ATP-dependent helicase/nuclease subunit B